MEKEIFELRMEFFKGWCAYGVGKRIEIAEVEVNKMRLYLIELVQLLMKIDEQDHSGWMYEYFLEKLKWGHSSLEPTS